MGSRKLVSREHVVPSSLLGPAPDSPRDRWPIVLKVHRDCELNQKRERDAWINAIHKIHIGSHRDRKALSNVCNSGISARIVEISKGVFVPALTNVSGVLHGVWRWVRGLHSALYGAYLHDNAGGTLFPPVPAFSDSDGLTFRSAEEMSEFIRHLVADGEGRGACDVLSAWGRHVVFKACWQRFMIDPPHPQEGFICAWTLSVPGLDEWSRLVLPRGLERPWHGFYGLPVPPCTASIVSRLPESGDHRKS